MSKINSYPLLTFREHLEKAANYFPNEIAVDSLKTDRRLTYEELDENSNKLANYFKETGIENGKSIAFLCRQGLEHWIAWSATHKINAVPVNISPKETPSNIAEMMERAKAKFLVFDSPFSEKVEAVKESLSNLEKSIPIGEETNIGDEGPIMNILKKYSSNPPDSTVHPMDKAFMQFTSGSTGKPKFFRFDYFQEFLNMLAGAWVHRLDHNEPALTGAAPSFIAWKTVVNPTLLLGGTYLTLEEWTPKNFLEIIQEKKPETVLATVTQWNMVMSELEDNPEEYNIGKVRTIFSVGEVPKAELVNKLEDTFDPFYVSNTWGASEVFPEGAATVGHSEKKLKSGGKPSPTCEMRIAEIEEEEGLGNPSKTLPVGEEGEFIVRGPTVVSEYIEMPEQEERAFENGWFHTEDVAYKDEEGDIYISGRLKNLIISGGVNIFPAEVENVLIQHPAVIDVIVIGADHPEWGEAVKAIVRNKEDVTEEELDEWCKNHEKLANHKRPRIYKFWGEEEFPKTSTGKIDRQKLKEEI